MVHKTFKKVNLTFKKLRKYHSRIRSHYVSDLKKATLSLFNLKHLKSNPQDLAEHVQYLLEDDRFLCPPENYEVRNLLGGHISLFNGKKSVRILNFAFLAPSLSKLYSGSTLRESSRGEEKTRRCGLLVSAGHFFA